VRLIYKNILSESYHYIFTNVHFNKSQFMG